jgi:hypothetical protein
VESVPVFLLSPVKTLPGGGRYDKFLSDTQYARSRDGMCVFRNTREGSCSIHAEKPFGCTLLICGKMTKAKPLVLNKTYYYHHWIDAQEIIFSIFPPLASLHRKLVRALSPLPLPGSSRRAALMTANAIINHEMYEMLNGCQSQGYSFYRDPGILDM